jgi:hypothetical protein
VCFGFLWFVVALNNKLYYRSVSIHLCLAPCLEGERGCNVCTGHDGDQVQVGVMFAYVHQYKGDSGCQGLRCQRKLAEFCA